ncbi:hypothetical protein HY468_04320 [Candidatus Roizmanbacteria bacterium]|nr:hypothetical protein [Candidatus Roizmanbacteria bacterium]
MRKVHLILSGLSATIILLSLNRLTPWTSGYLAPFEFLRWLDFNAMIPIPLISVLLYYLLKKNVEQNSVEKKSLASHLPFHKTPEGKLLVFNILFITGVYLFGAGSGDHEVTNYLNTRFCNAGEIKSVLCNIISYNDDEFSHIMYYLGFIALNISLMGIEYLFPRKDKITNRDLKFILINSLFIALGIFANLAFEPAGLDLIFFGSVTVLGLYLLNNQRNNFRAFPVLFYLTASYTIGIVATLLYKLATIA